MGKIRGSLLSFKGASPFVLPCFRQCARPMMDVYALGGHLVSFTTRRFRSSFKFLLFYFFFPLSSFSLMSRLHRRPKIGLTLCLFFSSPYFPQYGKKNFVLSFLFFFFVGATVRFGDGSVSVTAGHALAARRNGVASRGRRVTLMFVTGFVTSVYV